MAEAPAQNAPIAVYGATGYTGRLVAAELDRRGADFVLAGRNPAKLDALADELGGSAATSAVSLDDPAGLRELLEPCAVVIACAGPFTLHGEPVVAAAADAGVHYIDTTGEQPFIERVFQAFGPRAERAGCALAPAMGFDYAPGDMLASLTGEGMGPLDEITLAYSVRGFGPTRGTMLSGMEILKGGDVEYRDGAWRPAPQSVGRGFWDFPPPIGRQRMLRYPAGEQITVPRHIETRSVRTMLSAKSALPGPAADAAAVLLPPFQVALRTPLRRALGALVSRLPEGPDEEARRAARFMISCEARSGSARRRGSVTGHDLYGLTAFTTVHGALIAAAPGYDRAGALAPSQAFEPSRFLDALGELGVEHAVDPLPRREKPAAAAASARTS